jgi:23S rRNA (guanine745-N1)-methyltransferase
MQIGAALRCTAMHSFDLAREGYANLLPVERRHSAQPGDSKQMVRARRAFLSGGYYQPFARELARLCVENAPADRPAHIVDAGCGEGSYDAVVWQSMNAAGAAPQMIGFDLAREAVRMAAKLAPQAAFCVGGSFAAPVRTGWADLLLNVFSPFAREEFLRMLCPGGRLLYAVPTARHLFGLKAVLYDTPYENPVREIPYEGFHQIGSSEVNATVTVPGPELQNLFAMTPYFWKTPADGAARLEKLTSLTTEIGFRFLVYQKTER